MACAFDLPYRHITTVTLSEAQLWRAFQVSCRWLLADTGSRYCSHHLREATHNDHTVSLGISFKLCQYEEYSITPPSLFHFHLNEMRCKRIRLLGGISVAVNFFNYYPLSAVYCATERTSLRYSRALGLQKKRPAWHRKSLNCRRLLSFFFRTFSEIVTYSHHSTRGAVTVNDTRGGHVVKKLNYAVYYFPNEGINIYKLRIDKRKKAQDDC